MKILLIPSWYEINTNKTLGSFFKEQAIALLKDGHEVVIAYPGFVSVKTFGKNKIGIYKYKDYGINVYRYDTYNFMYERLDLKAKIFEKKLYKLYQYIKKYESKPDIIHVHSCLWGGYAAVKLGEREDIPVVLTEHSTAFSNDNIPKKSRKYIKYALNNTDRVLAVSNSLRKQMYQYCNNINIEVVNNMVNVDEFNLSSKQCNEKESFCFLTVCYLEEKKGLDILLKAFSKISKRNVKLRIGGKGAEEEYLKGLTAQLGIGDSVEFLGGLTRTEVIQEMKECDSFVLPSRHETFGVVFIEALASGKPIIATKCGGPEDIVNSSNGILVDVNNIDQLADAMVNIMTNYRSYNPELIRNECKNKYSEKNIVKKLNKIYKDVLEGR